MKKEGNTNAKHSRVPFAVIMRARQGNPDALDEILGHYNGYIIKGSQKRFRDDFGNVYYMSDEHMGKEIRGKLLSKIMEFQIF